MSALPMQNQLELNTKGLTIPDSILNKNGVNHEVKLMAEPYIKLLEDKNFEGYIKLANLDKIHERLNKIDGLIFLTFVINAIVKVNAVGPLYVTLSNFSPDSNKDDFSFIIGNLTSHYGFPINTLKYIISNYPNISAIEIIETQLSKNNGISIGYISDKLSEVYGENVMQQTEVNYLIEYASTNNLNNIQGVEWLKSTYDTKFTYADKPLWVNVEKGESLDLVNPKNWVNIENKSSEEFSDSKINEVLSNFNLRDEEGKIIDINDESIKDAIAGAKSTVAMKHINNYPGNPDRVFGPINRGRDTKCLTSIVGDDCRMLTCNCRSFDQDEDFENINTPNDPYEWFDGSCHCCNKKILDLSHVIRYPVQEGGWGGTYCSVECLRKLQPRTSTTVSELVLSKIFDDISKNNILDRHKLIKRAAKGKSVTKSKIISKQSTYTKDLPVGLSYIVSPENGGKSLEGKDLKDLLPNFDL